MSLFDTPDSQLWVDEANVITGGFVNNTEAHLLGPDQCVQLLNAEPTVAGRRRKRLGALPMGAGSVSLPPLGLFEMRAPGEGVEAIVGQWGSELYSSIGDDTWTRRGSNVSLASTFHTGVQGRCFFTPGSGAASGVTQVHAALFLASCVGVSDNASLPFGFLTQLSLFNGEWQATSVTHVRSRALAWFQNRLWAYGSCQPGLGRSFLQWSRVLDGFDFSNGQTVEIDPDSGDVGVAIVPARDATPRLFLFNERSVQQLDLYWATDGYYPTTANALDFTKSLVRPIVLGSGCVATRAVMWVPGQAGADLLFLSREGLRLLSRSATDAQGGTPLPLSHRIQPTIDRINWAKVDRACGVYWDGKAYFALPVDGADFNNFILAYDVHRDYFYELDWKVGAWSAAQIASERKLFFLSATSGTETALGSPASGVTHGYHVYEAFSGNSDPFTLPINFTEVTRGFTCDNGGQPGVNLRLRKKWSHLDVSLQSADTGSTVCFEYRVDDDEAWSALKNIYIDPESSAPVLPVQLPFGFGSGQIIRRTMLLRNIRSGYKLQFRVRDDSSFGRFRIIGFTLYSNPMNPKRDR